MYEAIKPSIPKKGFKILEKAPKTGKLWQNVLGMCKKITAAYMALD